MRIDDKTALVVPHSLSLSRTARLIVALLILLTHLSPLKGWGMPTTETAELVPLQATGIGCYAAITFRSDQTTSGLVSLQGCSDQCGKVQGYAAFALSNSTCDCLDMLPLGAVSVDVDDPCTGFPAVRSDALTACNAWQPQGISAARHCSSPCRDAPNELSCGESAHAYALYYSNVTAIATQTSSGAQTSSSSFASSPSSSNVTSDALATRSSHSETISSDSGTADPLSTTLKPSSSARQAPTQSSDSSKIWIPVLVSLVAVLLLMVGFAVFWRCIKRRRSEQGRPGPSDWESDAASTGSASFDDRPNTKEVRDPRRLSLREILAAHAGRCEGASDALPKQAAGQNVLSETVPNSGLPSLSYTTSHSSQGGRSQKSTTCENGEDEITFLEEPLRRHAAAMRSNDGAFYRTSSSGIILQAPPSGRQAPLRPPAAVLSARELEHKNGSVQSFVNREHLIVSAFAGDSRVVHTFGGLTLVFR